MRHIALYIALLAALAFRVAPVAGQKLAAVELAAEGRTLSVVDLAAEQRVVHDFDCAAGGQKLPEFVIADTSGRYLHVHPAHLKKPILLVYFQPDCGECQAFTVRLLKHPELSRKYQLIMVTNAGLPALRRFARAYPVLSMKGLILGTEGWTNFLLRALGVGRFPFVAVYGGEEMVREFGVAGDIFNE